MFVCYLLCAPGPSSTSSKVVHMLRKDETGQVIPPPPPPALLGGDCSEGMGGTNNLMPKPTTKEPLNTIKCLGQTHQQSMMHACTVGKEHNSLQNRDCLRQPHCLDLLGCCRGCRLCWCSWCSTRPPGSSSIAMYLALAQWTFNL